MIVDTKLNGAIGSEQCWWEFITVKISDGALRWQNKNVAEISKVKRKEMTQKYTSKKVKWCNRWYVNNDSSTGVSHLMKFVIWNKLLVFKF